MGEYRPYIFPAIEPSVEAWKVNLNSEPTGRSQVATRPHEPS